jgi:hypothetical protein
MTGERHPLLERVAYQVQRVRAWARRVIPTALLLRVVVWATGTAALIIAAPDAVVPAVSAVVAAGVAIGPAARPGGWWVSGLELSTVVLLVMSIGQQSGIGLPAVGAVAALLYLHHTAAAAAAPLRTDVLVPVAVVWHWARRSAVVLAASVAVGFGVALLPDAAPVWPGTVPVLLGGVAVLVAAAVLLGPVISRRSLRD